MNVFVLISLLCLTLLIGCNHAPSPSQENQFKNYINSNAQVEPVDNRQSNAIINVAF